MKKKKSIRLAIVDATLVPLVLLLFHKASNWCRFYEYARGSFGEKVILERRVSPVTGTSWAERGLLVYWSTRVVLASPRGKKIINKT